MGRASLPPSVLPIWRRRRQAATEVAAGSPSRPPHFSSQHVPGLSLGAAEPDMPPNCDIATQAPPSTNIVADSLIVSTPSIELGDMLDWVFCLLCCKHPHMPFIYSHSSERGPKLARQRGPRAPGLSCLQLWQPPSAEVSLHHAALAAAADQQRALARQRCHSLPPAVVLMGWPVCRRRRRAAAVFLVPVGWPCRCCCRDAARLLPQLGAALPACPLCVWLQTGLGLHWRQAALQLSQRLSSVGTPHLARSGQHGWQTQWRLWFRPAATHKPVCPFLLAGAHMPKTPRARGEPAGIQRLPTPHPHRTGAVSIGGRHNLEPVDVD